MSFFRSRSLPAAAQLWFYLLPTSSRPGARWSSRRRTQRGKERELRWENFYICSTLNITFVYLFLVVSILDIQELSFVYLFFQDRLNSRHLSCQIESNGKEAAQMLKLKFLGGFSNWSHASDGKLENITITYFGLGLFWDKLSL